MRSPMIKRIPRELKHNTGRHVGIFLLLTMAIAITSAFLVAAGSMEHLAQTMRDTYMIEDAYLTTHFSLDDEALDEVQTHDARLYENFSKEVPATISAVSSDGERTAKEVTFRLFKNRSTINKAIYVEGSAPTHDHEIALSRVFAANNGIHVGDTVDIAGEVFEISGIMTLSDASTTFGDAGDFIFNTVSFDFVQVSDEGFENLEAEHISYTYSIVFDDRNLDAKTRIEKERDIAASVADAGAIVTSVVDCDSNKSITYALDDIQGDRTMWMTLIVLLFIIIAFVFVILTNATIESQSSALGTLLASGYTKWELIRHYMTLPTLIGISSAVVGNIVGRLWLIEFIKDLYYNSYNLPPYEQIWDSFVFVETTIFPVSILLIVTFVGLAFALRLRPLQFLRHETSPIRASAAVALPQKIPFSTRFRMRIFTKNWLQFATLFIGIMFGSLLLVFGFCLLPTMDYNAEQMSKNVLAEHVYMLKTPVEIDASEQERAAYAALERLTFGDVDDLPSAELANLMMLAANIDKDAYMKNTLQNDPDAVAHAEKIAVTSLAIDKPRSDTPEEVSVYGMEERSTYKDIDVSNNRVVAGAGLIDKFGFQVGEEVNLYDKITGDTYAITIDGEIGNKNDMSIYMSRAHFNQMFDNDDTWFNGYISDEVLHITPRYIATEITPGTMKRMSEQMHDSMGSMIYLIVGISLPIYFVLMYLLTKIVIERNARYISYMKVFGYTNAEINALYIRSISATVIVSLFASIPLLIVIVKWLVAIAMYNYSGNFVVATPFSELMKVAILGLITYAVVAFVHVRAIRKVPLSLAMKSYE